MRAVVEQYCVSCHDGDAPKGGLDLASVADADVGAPPAGLGEGRPPAARRGRCRPRGRSGRTKRPTPPSCRNSRPRSIARRPTKPNPGRTDTIRRLTRTEYQNAVRDLLGIHIDATALLPADEASHGFDNVTVSELSPALLDRYITAAQKISRLAVGSTRRSPDGDTIRVKPDITQEDRVDGLPVGTRGGTLIRYTFPQDGEYDVQIRLARDRNEHVEGLREPHELEVLLDRERVKSFTVKPPASDKGHETADAHLKVRLSAKAGSARPRRDVREAVVVAAGNHAPAVQRALQPAPPPAAHARGVPGVDHRPVRGEGAGRHAQPPAHLRRRPKSPDDDHQYFYRHVDLREVALI